MNVTSAKKIEFISIKASGRSYRVYRDGDIEIGWFPQGPVMEYKLLGRDDPNYAELLEIASKLWWKENEWTN